MTKGKSVQQCKLASSQLTGPEYKRIRIGQHDLPVKTLHSMLLSSLIYFQYIWIFFLFFFKNHFKFLGSRYHDFLIFKYTHSFGKLDSIEMSVYIEPLASVNAEKTFTASA